jgi:hypothetical protein
LPFRFARPRSINSLASQFIDRRSFLAADRSRSFNSWVIFKDKVTFLFWLLLSIILPQSRRTNISTYTRWKREGNGGKK